jgi:hypothetical protein
MPLDWKMLTLQLQMESSCCQAESMSLRINERFGVEVSARP